MPFIVSVGAGWEWFLTTILAGSATEFITVKNCSHNILKPCPDSIKFSYLIKLAAFGCQRSAGGGTPETLN